MPFCTECGNNVGDGDQFCNKCGKAQAKTQSSAGARAADFWRNISDRNASMLCYVPVIGWIAAIGIMASGRFRGNARVMFHAFQGLYLWVAWLMVEWVVQPMFSFGDWDARQAIPRLLEFILTGAWIFMLIKVHHGEDYHLPFVGDLAERSLTEQSRP